MCRGFFVQAELGGFGGWRGRERRGNMHNGRKSSAREGCMIEKRICKLVLMSKREATNLGSFGHS